MARRKADTHSACARGSKGGRHKASSTRGRSHAGTLCACGGRNLKAPFRKRDTSLWHPRVLSSTRVSRGNDRHVHPQSSRGLSTIQE